MKRIFLIIALFLSVCALAQIEKVIPAKPAPQRLVNDLAHVMTPEQVQALESKLVAYDDSTSNQVAVVTMSTTGDYEISEVALGILRSWGVGGAKNNGVVILAAIQDRKIWISTGYGLEGAVPDVTAKAIIENDIKPRFREEAYYRGFDAATTSLIRAAAGEYKAPEGYRNRGRGGGLSPGKIFIAIIVLFVILSMFGGGNRGGGYMSRRGYRGFWGPMIFPTGGGSSWGGSSGGGGFGGGFGGFGGGSGGGGGAGGSW